MTIKEMIIGTGEDGVTAISFVDDPANDTLALILAQEQFGRASSNKYIADDQGYLWYRFSAYPETEVITTSHKFCKQRAGKVFHRDEVKNWARFKDGQYYQGFIPESNFFANFPQEGYACHAGIYNCRHNLVAVADLNEVPKSKISRFCKEINDNILDVKLAMDAKRKEIIGVVLRPKQLIYRKDLGNGEDGYIYFSTKTIKEIKEKYGLNKNVTLQHQGDITGTVIHMASWLYEEGQDNYGLQMEPGTWLVKYKVVSDQLWEYLEKKGKIGLSLEGFFSLK